MSGSVGKTESQNQNTASQDIWGAQAPYLQDLFAQGQSTLGDAQAINQQIMPNAQQAWQGMIQPQGNPYLQQMGQSGLDQLQQNFGQTLNQIKGNSVAGGSLGNSRQGVAEGIAARDMQTQGNNFLTQLYGGQYQQDQNRALAGLQMTPQVAQQAFAPLAGYQQLLGSPTVLGSSQGSGSSKGKSAGAALKQ